MNSILQSKRVNLGALTTAGMLALLQVLGIDLDDDAKAKVVQGLTVLWAAIIASDAYKPMVAKAKTLLAKDRKGSIAGAIAAWVALLISTYSLLVNEPQPKPEPANPNILVAPAEPEPVVDIPVPVAPVQPEPEPVAPEPVEPEPQPSPKPTPKPMPRNPLPPGIFDVEIE